MREDQRVIDLIGDIHDAALDATLWPDVLVRITNFVGGQACGLGSISAENEAIDAPFLYNLDPHYMQLYWEYYGKFDPQRTLPRFNQMHVLSVQDLLPYSEFRQGQFYQEWARPQGWIDHANVVLEKSRSACIFLNVIRSKSGGMVDDEMRRRLALIASHARRSLLIGRATDIKQSEATNIAATLDALSAGVFLVDAGGRIVHANAAGHEMLYANECLRSTAGRLAARDLQINQTLREVFAAAANGDAGIGAKAIALALTAQDGERYVAHVLPLTSGVRRDTGLAYTAVAAVFVRKATLGSPSEVIAQTYQLTPTELRVLHAIVEIGGVPETAVALGVAETTVKTHLYRLFDKIGVSRQADLVKVTAGFSNPLAS